MISNHPFSWLLVVVALALIGLGVWTWLGPIGQAPAQVGPSWKFLLGVALGVLGVVLLVLAACVAILVHFMEQV